MTGLPFLFSLSVLTGVATMLSVGSRNCTPRFLAFSRAARATSVLSASTSDFPILQTLRQLESVSHRAADQNGVRFFQQPVNDLDFVGNFRAAENDDERSGRGFQFVTEKFQFAFHQPPRICRRVRR